MSRPTRSRRVEGTSERPSSTACGREVIKYKVSTRTVKNEKKPERTDFPTPITPPKVDINNVPLEVTDFNFS